MLETKSGVFVVAGLLFFGVAFVVMGFLPWVIYRNVPEQTVEQMIELHGIVPEFVELAEKYPDKFAEYFGPCNAESFAAALRRGRDVYVAEACWHCHSQFVRPVSKEQSRWGPVAHAREYQNELQRPVLFGTRRVGPDLSREAGRRSNDWHIAHFYKPTAIAPLSVMPEYPWFFDDQGYPNRDGMSLIAYVQWLGSWLEVYPYYQGEGPKGPGEAEDVDFSDM